MLVLSHTYGDELYVNILHVLSFHPILVIFYVRQPKSCTFVAYNIHIRMKYKCLVESVVFWA